MNDNLVTLLEFPKECHEIIKNEIWHQKRSYYTFFVCFINTKYNSVAPNYCDQRGNDGAWLTIRPDKGLVPIPTEFTAVEHPPCQPMMYANPMMRMAGIC